MATRLLLLLLLLLMSVLLGLTAKAFLVDASPCLLKHFAVDHHHHHAREVEGTDGREDCISQILKYNTPCMLITKYHGAEINPFNASCSKLLLFEVFSAVLV